MKDTQFSGTSVKVDENLALFTFKLVRENRVRYCLKGYSLVVKVTAQKKVR